jgi:hypothetical protein
MVLHSQYSKISFRWLNCHLKEHCFDTNCWINKRGDESVMGNLYHLLILLTSMYIILTYSTMFINSSSIYYFILNMNIHSCIMKNNKQIHTIQITPIFYMETQCGRKPHNYFLIFQRITFKEAPTSNSLYPTRRRIQPLMFSSSNWKVATTTQFSGSNQKENPTP